jgi:hypothetical protein
MMRICRAPPLAYHKYISNIASSGFSGLTAVENYFAA